MPADMTRDERVRAANHAYRQVYIKLETRGYLAHMEGLKAAFASWDATRPPLDPATVEASSGFAIVPIEPNADMIRAYHDALRNHIHSVPIEERAARWGFGRKRRGTAVYDVPEHEKAAARWQAMIRASAIRALTTTPGEERS